MSMSDRAGFIRKNYGFDIEAAQRRKAEAAAIEILPDCASCGRTYLDHVETRWQGGPGRVDVALLCPDEAEGLAPVLPPDYFLPLLDEVTYVASRDAALERAAFQLKVWRAGR